MKTPSDDLFTLIKSLDAREKGFFKVYSAKKGANNTSLSYLKLFDNIDKLKTYDEPYLISKLKKTGFTDHAKGALIFLYPVRKTSPNHANKSGRPAVAIMVILGSPDRFGDGRKIIQWFDETIQ